MDFEYTGKSQSTTATRPLQKRLNTHSSKQSHHTSRSPGQHNNTMRNPTPQQHSILGKRTSHCSRDSSRNRNSPNIKRPRHAVPSSNNQLCQQCSSIPWHKIEQWMTFGGKINWHGKLIVRVEKRYRNIPPSTTCPLCRQLHSPWIASFLKTQDPSIWKGKYFGDELHIFRHLRHLTHVNGFQTSMNVLRTNDAPYHIAVVPFAGNWRDSLQAHMAAHGMVVVMPEGRIESEIFVPQRVARKFDPDMALPWLRFCRDHHKTLCGTKVRSVGGMKVIDCESKGRNIQYRRPTDEYVALSYVWGPQAPTKTATETSMSTSKEIPQTEESTLRLPKDIPLTIEDAIQVTKALGYRFLWVDKYCINQESESEKQQQVSRMGDIYAGSQVTIFALGSDSNYGLPGISSRPRVWQRQCTKVGKYNLISTMPDPQISINQSKWSTRGWTHQEGLFSTRRLFFTNHQAYFECNAMNCVEAFKSNLKILHTQNGQRFRAFHRAGIFICGNSNKYSHLNVKENKANHRKIDTIRRCQFHTHTYTKRELTNKDDILNAFAGIAHFYTKTSAKIASLAGIPIPFPIAKLGDLEREHLSHLSYALAWTHHTYEFSEPKLKSSQNVSKFTRSLPQRRDGFPSWSWAGWFGEIQMREDLPYCWNSALSSVRIGFRGSSVARDYAWLTKCKQTRPIIVQKLLEADELQFEAHVLSPRKLKFWKKDPRMPSRQIPSETIHINLSKGASSLEKFEQKLMNGELLCLVIGTYGEPREDIFKAITAADKKSPKASKGRISLLERLDPDAIICLVVCTVKGISFRRGILKIEFKGAGKEDALQQWDLGPKRSFVLR